MYIGTEWANTICIRNRRIKYKKKAQTASPWQTVVSWQRNGFNKKSIHRSLRVPLTSLLRETPPFICSLRPSAERSSTHPWLLKKGTRGTLFRFWLMAHFKLDLSSMRWECSPPVILVIAISTLASLESTVTKLLIYPGLFFYNPHL